MIYLNFKHNGSLRRLTLRDTQDDWELLRDLANVMEESMDGVFEDISVEVNKSGTVSDFNKIVVSI